MIALREMFESGGGGAARFATGDVVRHRRYGYRGVIVHRDASCQASDTWYWGNQTQPERDQPWYYVFVDESDQVTYAAESSLEADEQGSCVMHPLVNLYFDGFDEGKYHRNDKPWDEEPA